MPACIATFNCRVGGDALEHLRIHFVLDKNAISELEGSWLQFSLLSGLLECAPKGGTERSVLGTDFFPLHTTDDKTTAHAEMFYVLMPIETWSSDSSKREKAWDTLVNCAKDTDEAQRLAHELKLPFTWQRHATPPPSNFRAAIRAASHNAAIVVQMSMIPDVGSEQMRSVAGWLHSAGIHSAQRAMVLHYRAGRLPTGWGQPQK